MAYSAVIFDLFGTLIENFTTDGYNSALARMAEALGAPEKAFKEAWWKTVDDRMTGMLGDMAGNVEWICRGLELRPAPEQVARAVETRLDFTRRCFVPRTGAVDTLARLKSAGFRLGLVSDCTAEVPALWDTTPFAPFVDETVFSCSEGVRKPDARIYRLACDRLGVDPSECIYVGDGSSQELTGALEVGMRPVLILGPDIDLAGVDRTDALGWSGDVISALPQVLEITDNEWGKGPVRVFESPQDRQAG